MLSGNLFEEKCMNCFLKSLVFSILFWQASYCPTNVHIMNNLPGVTLKVGPTVVTSNKDDKKLKEGKHYTIADNKLIKPLSRGKILDMSRHKLPWKLGESVHYFFNTKVEFQDEDGNSIGEPVYLTQKLKKPPTDLTVSTIKYGVSDEPIEGAKALGWQINNRSVDMYGGDYRMWNKSFGDIEYGLSVRPFKGAEFDDDSNIMRVLTYNIWMRSYPVIFSTQDGSGPLARAKILPKTISGIFNDIKPDVIAVNELFEPSVYGVLKKKMAAEGYKYATKVIGEVSSEEIVGEIVEMGIEKLLNLFRQHDKNERRELSNGGVALFSKWPIEKTEEIVFEACDGDDCFAKKGCLYARINKGGKKYHFFATHTESAQSRPDVREVQFARVKEFIDEQKICETEPVFILGDLNVLKFNQTGPKGARVISAVPSDEYKATLETLGAVDPEHSGGGSSSEGEVLDYVLYSKDHLQPKKSHTETMKLLLQKPWLSGIVWEWQKKDIGKNKWALSDHKPVFGYFEF